jgi:hypothetical protein
MRGVSAQVRAAMRCWRRMHRDVNFGRFGSSQNWYPPLFFLLVQEAGIVVRVTWAVFSRGGDGFVQFKYQIGD